MSVASVTSGPALKRAASESRRETALIQNRTESAADSAMVTVFGFLSIQELGRSACVNTRWRALVSSNHDKLWSLVNFADVPRVDEIWWQRNPQLSALGLDPAGAPRMRKETLKAAVSFLKSLGPLVKAQGKVVDLTVPRGLSFDACEKLGAIFEQQFKQKLFDCSLAPEELQCMLESSICTLGLLDHKRCTRVEQTTRLFVTTAFSFSQKEAKPLVALAAKIRPLPVGYDLADSHDRLLSKYAAYPLDVSDPYIRFYSGTPDSQRIDYWIRGNGIGSRILIRIVNDAGTDYKEERAYAAR